MYNPFYQNLKDDNVLKYISVLSVLEQNSSFCHRLAIAQMAAYAMWKRDDIDWCELESILKKGEPQWEDPQEVLFIETLNTPFDSYRVFSSFLLTHKYNLSQLLYLSHRINFPQKKLSIVYALLTISDIIAQRFGYQRYVIGKLDHNEIYHLSFNDYNTIKNYTTYTKTELGNILENYDLTVANLAHLMLKVEAQVIQNEHASQGYSDAFEMHPFIELKDGTYLVTFPSALLRTAYMYCYGIMQNEIGESQLLDLVESEMVQETGAILQGFHYKLTKRQTKEADKSEIRRYLNDAVKKGLLAKGENTTFVYFDGKETQQGKSRIYIFHAKNWLNEEDYDELKRQIEEREHENSNF